MTLTVFAIAIAIICAIVITWAKRRKNRSELDRHSISAENLKSMMASGRQVLLFDVRQPLDLLAYPELIPGAKRIPPQDVIDNPSLIPQNEDIVVYCTCPGDKTSQMVLRRALALGFTRIKFLTGGWRLGKRRGILWNPIENPFGFRFQPRPVQQDNPEANKAIAVRLVGLTVEKETIMSRVIQRSSRSAAITISDIG